ncbi:hypothetical protein HZC21_01190 [Candidatus Peregrinibacteria bacterium]|nr:hypothetical protein [Candidatus Peregrinibacteria bacterium]
MTNKIQNSKFKIQKYIFVAVLIFVFTISPVLFLVQPAFAANAPSPATSDSSETENQKDESVKPAVIPCPKNLPCIQPGTQEQGGAAIREHVIGKFAVTFLTGFLGLAAATSVIFIIVGGLQMHLAFGNDEAVGTAKKTLTWALLRSRRIRT